MRRRGEGDDQTIEEGAEGRRREWRGVRRGRAGKKGWEMMGDDDDDG